MQHVIFERELLLLIHDGENNVGTLCIDDGF